MTHGIQKYKCCLGLTDAECANIPSRHCTGLAPDHGTHGPQWVNDEIRKAEKMTHKFETEPKNLITILEDHNGNQLQVGSDITDAQALEKLSEGYPIRLLHYRLQRVSDIVKGREDD